MIRLILKFVIYTLIIYLFSVMGLIKGLETNALLILSAVLTGINTLLRPLFVAIALPFNLISFGVASVFANLLALVIANGISGNPISGFWLMFLLSFVIMLADDIIRYIRDSGRRNRAHRRVAQ